jgi:hypothetical protein
VAIHVRANTSATTPTGRENEQQAMQRFIATLLCEKRQIPTMIGQPYRRNRRFSRAIATRLKGL